MSIAVTIDLPVDPQRTDEFLEFIGGIAPDTRAYDGCELFDIYTDQERPGRVLFYEIWESKDKQQKYIAWRTETGLVETLGKFLTGPPTFSFFDKFDG
jgi:quinol monooxygenase YgiN